MKDMLDNDINLDETVSIEMTRTEWSRVGILLEGLARMVTVGSPAEEQSWDPRRFTEKIRQRLASTERKKS